MSFPPGEQAARRKSAFMDWMERQRQSVATVARVSGVPASTLYSYVQGKSDSLKGSTEARIAAAFNATVDEIFGGSQATFVDVRGRVGARAEVFPFDEAGEPSYRVELPPTVDTSSEYVAFEIEGLSMPPARPGWVIIFRNVRTNPDDYLGYPVLADLADGRRLFKVLRRGYVAGRYNLESWDGSDPIENVELTACLPFVAMTPGKMAR